MITFCRTLVAVVIVCVGLAGFSAVAGAQTTVSVSSDAASEIEIGDAVQLSASGFDPGSAVRFDAAGIELGFVYADGDGNASMGSALPPETGSPFVFGASGEVNGAELRAVTQQIQVSGSFVFSPAFVLLCLACLVVILAAAAAIE